MATLLVNKFFFFFFVYFQFFNKCREMFFDAVRPETVNSVAQACTQDDSLSLKVQIGMNEHRISAEVEIS